MGGEAPGTPAPHTWSPAEAGDPEWERYVRESAAHLEVRAEVEGGPHVVGVSFVRNRWEPEGPAAAGHEGRSPLERREVPRERRGPGPSPSRGPTRARSPTTRRAGGASSCAGPLPRRRRKRAPAASCRGWPASPTAGRPRTAMSRRCSGSSGTGGRRTAATSTPAFSSPSSGCSSIPTSSCGCTRIRPVPRRGRRTPCPTSSSPRACRSSSGAASPTTRCSTRPSAAS